MLNDKAHINVEGRIHQYFKEISIVQIDILVYLKIHLSKNNKGCALLGIRTSNYDSKNNNITTSNVCIPCLPTTIFV